MVFISPLPAPIGDNNSDGLVMMHTGLKDKIDSGEVTWIKREWREEDLTSLGREEVGKVVDAVFVTVNVGCRREIGLGM